MYRIICFNASRRWTVYLKKAYLRWKGAQKIYIFSHDLLNGSCNLSVSAALPFFHLDKQRRHKKAFSFFLLLLLNFPPSWILAFNLYSNGNNTVILFSRATAHA